MSYEKIHFLFIFFYTGFAQELRTQKGGMSEANKDFKCDITLYVHRTQKAQW